MQLSNLLPSAIDILRVAQTLSHQFPKVRAETLLTSDSLELKVSRRTARVVSVFHGDVLLFSLRHNDGRWQPTFSGMSLLLEYGLQSQIVVAKDEAVPFIQHGKSLFSRYVQFADPNIRPRSEVAVLSPDKKLLATGLALHPAYAMGDLQMGVAVKIKHTATKSAQELQ